MIILQLSCSLSVFVVFVTLNHSANLAEFDRAIFLAEGTDIRGYANMKVFLNCRLVAICLQYSSACNFSICLLCKYRIPFSLLGSDLSIWREYESYKFCAVYGFRQYFRRCKVLLKRLCLPSLRYGKSPKVPLRHLARRSSRRYNGLTELQYAQRF